MWVCQRYVFVSTVYGPQLKPISLKTRNNNGKKSFLFKDVPSLTKADIALMEGSALAQFHTPTDPLSLDPTLDRQQTAEHIAALFPKLYNLVKTSEKVPAGWFIQLIKRQRKLKSTPGQVSATAHQLIQRASMEA
jgi:hypothetical protein